MIEFDVTFTVWLREMKGIFRNRERFLGSLALPFFLFLIFGTGLAATVQFRGLNLDYSVFLVPGIVALPLIFTAVSTGVSLILDRQFGFMKEMLVAPVSRVSIILGKSFSGATIATLQATLILILFILFGIKPTISLLISIPAMFIVGLGFVGLAIIVASLLETIEGYNLAINFIGMPLFFLSGIFFPIKNLPIWLEFLSHINPLTYGVELLRYIITGFASISFYTSFPIVLIFTTSTIIIGSYLFSKRQ